MDGSRPWWSSVEIGRGDWESRLRETFAGQVTNREYLLIELTEPRENDLVSCILGNTGGYFYGPMEVTQEILHGAENSTDHGN
jgi:hypothetical protein